MCAREGCSTSGVQRLASHTAVCNYLPVANSVCVATALKMHKSKFIHQAAAVNIFKMSLEGNKTSLGKNPDGSQSKEEASSAWLLLAEIGTHQQSIARLAACTQKHLLR
jgi:hypothetical protein